MSSEFNKQIVHKTQKLLKEYGHDVKTGHLYEIFSKLADESSWNVANSKKISIKEKIVSLFKKEEKHFSDLNQNEQIALIKNEYMKIWNTNPLDMQVLFGYSLDNNNLVSKILVSSPHSIFAGGMGSGKSLSACYSVISAIKSNPTKSLVYILDHLKGAADFVSIFEASKGVFVRENFGEVIDQIYSELKDRDSLLKQKNERHIFSYEKNNNHELDRIFLVIESGHAIFHHPQFDLAKFKYILQMGGTLGCYVTIVSQRITSTDLPSPFMAYFDNKHLAKVSPAESSYVFAHTDASKIESSARGKFMTENGLVQFPYFTDKEQIELLSEFYKEKQVKCLTITNHMFK